MYVCAGFTSLSIKDHKIKTLVTVEMKRTRIYYFVHTEDISNALVMKMTKLHNIVTNAIIHPMHIFHGIVLYFIFASRRADESYRGQFLSHVFLPVNVLQLIVQRKSLYSIMIF